MLDINCDKCGAALEQPGALLITPPANGTRFVHKLHICVVCYEEVINQFGPLKILLRAQNQVLGEEG